MFKVKNFLKSGLSALTAGVLLAGTAGVMPQNDENAGNPVKVSAATTATVDLSKTYQYIRGFGGIDLPEWQGYSLNDSELRYAFGNGPGELGLTVLRVFVNPDKNQWSKTLKTAQYATKQGATLFATPWEPPANIAENGSGGARGGKKHLNKNNYGAYAQHLNDFGTYMKNNNAPIYSISVQNEPDYASEWTAWSTSETTDFIANYGDRITSTRLMSPESFQYGAWNDGKDYYSKILNNAKAMANCDVFGTHFYGTPRDKMDFPALESCGKEIWMTEVYVPGSDNQNANIWVGKDLKGKDDASAIKVAENIHNGLVVGNMSVYTWWYIKRYYSLIGEERSGVMSASEAGKPTKRGYAMAQYSKWVRPGYMRTAVTEQPQSNVLVSAYKGDSNKVVIVAINQGSDVTQEFSISGQTLTNVDRYRTSANENLAETKGMETNGGNFFAQLPSNSVSTFVCTISGTHGVNGTSDGPVVSEPVTMEPDAKGYYFQDTFENGLNDWEARGSVKMSQSGRAPYAGTEALVVSERTAVWNGVQKSLPVSTFKPGEKFAFSACVNFLDSDDTENENFSMTLQYNDGSGTTKYANIDTKRCTKGSYVQLYNSGYQIPAGATEMQLVIETSDNTMNFYVDDVIIAKAGTAIDGPKEQEIVTTVVTTTVTTVTTTEATTVTEAPVTTTVPVTEAPPATEPSKAPEVIKGDADNNGTVNTLDLAAVIQHLVSKVTLSGEEFINADMNSDGKISIIDLILLKNKLA